MKKHILLSLLAGLTLPVTSALAWEVATPVPGTAIDHVPFTITAPGNYYLATNLTFSLPAGAAITINASEVYLDLNGKTLSSTLGTSQNMGILVFNQVDVTIQEGDIDGFQYGVYLAPNSTDNNKKNVVDNVRFNKDGFGIVSISGESNWIKNCIIDGGDVGVYIIADLGGTRVSNNIFEAQKASEFPGLGMAIVVGGGAGTYFDNNLISKGSSAFGQVLGSADKFRFETFVGGAGHVGGVDQLATSL